MKRLSSTEDQVDGFSLDAQRALGEKYAKEKGLRIVKAWAVDESASKEEDRKHFFEMIELVKERGIKHVIFDKVDRACRGLKSAVQIEELIDKHGVKFHFTREHLIIDSGSPPQEKLRFYLGMILGKYYIDNLKTEVHKGLEARLQAGLWNGLAPIGYRNVKVGKEQRAVVVPDPETAPVIREIFLLYATGNYSYDALSKIIREKTPRKSCTRRAMEDLICNPFYYGVMKVHAKGLSMNMGERLIQGQHEPLIDKDLFDACQRVKGIRASSHQASNSRVIPKPFMGWIKCGVCGHQVTGEVHKKPSGRIYVYYHCAHQACPERRKNVAERIISDAVKDAFVPFSKITQEMTRILVKAMQECLEDLDLYTQIKTSQFSKERLELKREIMELEALRDLKKVSDTTLDRLIADCQSRLKEKDLDLKAHQRADRRTFERARKVIELLHLVYDFIKLGGNDLEKARLAKMVLSNPTLKDGKLQFAYVKPFDVLIDLTSLPDWGG